MINERFNFTKKPKQYAPLSLAFIGDGVYEQYVRSRVIEENPDMPAHKLAKETVKRVCAHAQSTSMNTVCDMLTEDELTMYKRGRNAKSPTTPKNADLTEYRRATGLETLVGYLYLTGDEDRLFEVMREMYDNAFNEAAASSD